MMRNVFGGSKIRAALAGTALVGIVSALLWAGNASGEASKDEPPAPEGFSTASEAKGAYGAAEANFGAEFPNDVKLPAMSERIQQLVDNAGGSAVFEDGYAESELVTTWRCAWERSYYDAVQSKDVEAHARAAGELAGYYDLEYVKKWVDDPDHLWYKETIAPALNGHLQPLEDDLINSCGPPFAPAPSE